MASPLNASSYDIERTASIDRCQALPYNSSVRIVGFSHKSLKRFYEDGTTKGLAAVKDSCSHRRPQGHLELACDPNLATDIEVDAALVLNFEDYH